MVNRSVFSSHIIVLALASHKLIEAIQNILIDDLELILILLLFKKEVRTSSTISVSLWLGWVGDIVKNIWLLAVLLGCCRVRALWFTSHYENTYNANFRDSLIRPFQSKLQIQTSSLFCSSFLSSKMSSSQLLVSSLYQFYHSNLAFSTQILSNRPWLVLIFPLEAHLLPARICY